MASPAAMASHRVVVGQVILPTEGSPSAGRVSAVKVGVQVALVARVAGSPSSRRMGRRRRDEPATVADPLSSQVEVVGQANDRGRLVKVVAAGATTAQVSCCGPGLSDRPGQEDGTDRRGAQGIAAVGRGAGHLRDVGHARPARCRSTSCPGPRRWCGSPRRWRCTPHPHRSASRPEVQATGGRGW